MMVDESAWHLDKKIPIAIIVAIVVQTSGFIWFLSGLNSQVEQMSKTNDQQDERIHAVEQAAQTQAVSSASITQQISALKDVLEQMRQDQRETNGLLRRYIEDKKP
jgi:Tfp pilus assembly protein PilO